jgi:hypothetical protein
MDLFNNLDEQTKTTIIQTLSANILKYAENNNTMLVDLLSATRTMTLSGIPLSPYERLKRKYFDPKYVFKTINDVEIVEDTDSEELQKSIKKFNKTLNAASLSSLSAAQINANNITNYSLSSLNNEFDYVIDHNLVRCNIQYSEVISSMTLEQMENDPVETTKKLVTHYKTIYKDYL